MKEAIKLVPVVVFLAVSVMIFAQGPAMGLEGASSSQKMMVIDPRVRDDMMATSKETGR